MAYNLAISLERPIAFYPQIARALGGVNEALYFQQLYYWSDKGSREDGFIYKTKEEIEEETCLTRKMQDACRKHLESLGILETILIKANGAPTLHYRIDDQRAMEVLSLTRPTNGIAPKGRRETTQRDYSIGPNGTNPLTETTTESTAETTTNTRSSSFSLTPPRMPKSRTESKPEAHPDYLLNIPAEDITAMGESLKLSRAAITAKAEELHDWLIAKGKQRSYKDFRAFLRNALRRDADTLRKRYPGPSFDETIERQSEEAWNKLHTPDLREQILGPEAYGR